MRHIKAIGFDLFNTLITAEPHTFDQAMSRLIHSLGRSGLALEPEAFREAHGRAALRFIEKTRQDGRETHNRFWISAALETQGHHIPPHDPRIAEAVDAYFSSFIECCHLIPGTRQMLDALQGRYPLGLLSNFTHPPAARAILE
ncbi:MAG: HAD family hydrolase, partial [Deltaproteobacteria bacterium]|nr:HAD family hydrolase [Deltaproteobacteria bacterium]